MSFNWITDENSLRGIDLSWYLERWSWITVFYIIVMEHNFDDNFPMGSSVSYFLYSFRIEFSIVCDYIYI